MEFFRSFIVGGYAYYRKKGFGHSGSVSMLLFSSLGFVLIIFHGILNSNGFSFFSNINYYGYVFLVFLCFLWLHINARLCKFLKKYEIDFESSIGAKEIKFHSYITYFLIAIFIFVRVFI